jgi:hypothetical protein
MSEVKKVRVKLAADCLVDGVVMKAGDVVAIDSAIAKDFGEIQKDAKEVTDVKIREDK